jgi:hypothetical protein
MVPVLKGLRSGWYATVLTPLPNKNVKKMKEMKQRER